MNIESSTPGLPEPCDGPAGEAAAHGAPEAEGLHEQPTLPQAWRSRLRNAETLLRMAASMGRLGGWSVEVPSLNLTWSDEVCAIHEVRSGFSCTVQEALDFYAPPYREAIAAAFGACMKEGKPFDKETQIVTAKGEWVWVRAMGAAERDESGNIVRVQGAFQDISKPKLAAQRARELGERLTATLESLTHAFFAVDREWRFTYVNPRGEEVLQRDRRTLLGNTLWTEFPEALGTVFHQQYERALRDNVLVEFEALYPPLGIWVQVRAYPSPQGLAVSFEDVTERVNSRQEIMRLNAELEERVRIRTAELQAATQEMEAFSYSVAHDLRSPLCAIDGYSQMLDTHEADKVSPRGRHFLMRIRAATRQMDEMTEGLLALSRLSRSPLRREFVDLAPLALRILAGLQERDPGRQVAVDVMLALWAEGDVVLLTQVLDNLLGNAWKFTSKQPQARIAVGMKMGADDEPVYFVKDNGAGFDMAHAGKLFQVFHRLHAAADFAGTGIGLATVQKVVRRHGGRIWAEAAAGQGAAFYFTLGLAAGNAAGAAS
jgi:hypothetical protein